MDARADAELWESQGKVSMNNYIRQARRRLDAELTQNDGREEVGPAHEASWGHINGVSGTSYFSELQDT